MANLEASISLCDPMNPGFGYQVRITRAAAPGAPVDVLSTSRDPATGEDLLTYEQCLGVLTMYRSATKHGFVLKAEGSTRHFFSSYIEGDMQYVEDRDYAWFTTDRDTADAMVLDLAIRAGENFEVVPHVHP